MFVIKMLTDVSFLNNNLKSQRMWYVIIGSNLFLTKYNLLTYYKYIST